jgi:cell fate (sporulation/competence/biofilm development) regulator YlbF (YheA/YmcA/DUF963 family)
MASTEEILKTARQLGEMIGEHPAAKKYETVLKKLQDDTAAQRALTDYNRHAQSLARKEHEGKPIEVEDKRKLDALQKAVMTNDVLGELQMAQMDYLDLMRKVDDAMSPPEVAPPEVPPGAEAIQPG